MIEMIQEVLFSSWVVRVILIIAFGFVSHWSLRRLHEYAGYALGFLMGLFFILVYISLGGGANGTPPERTTLNIFEVFIATLFGILFGAGIMVGLRIGTRFARGVALQVALYTALSLILLFLAFIEGPIAQRMIGIFALAIAIASLFAMVLFPSHHRQEEVTAFSAQSAAPRNNNAQSASRLETIRQQMQNRDQRR